MNDEAPVVEIAQEEKKGMSPLMMGVIALVVLVGGGMLLLSMNKTGTTSPSDTSNTLGETQAETEQESATSGSESVPGSIDSSEATVIEVEGGSFYFKPNEIRVKEGDKVRIVLKSVDMMHDFNIDEFGVKVPITKSGETGVVEFVASKKGSYEFYCSVGQHRKNGQVGTLIVE